MNYAAAIVVDDSSLCHSSGDWGNLAPPVSTRFRPKSTTSARTPNYREIVQIGAEEFKKEVKFLIERWTNEVKNISSFSDMVSHKDYKTISAKGSGVIPILLNELRHRPHFWFDALQILIKANLGIDVDPVNEEDRGDLLKMADAWLAWGEENDFI